MNIEQLNWIDGLDQTGWIAIALFTVFFIIVVFAIAMMLKLNAENKRHQQKKSNDFYMLSSINKIVKWKVIELAFHFFCYRSTEIVNFVPTERKEW